MNSVTRVQVHRAEPGAALASAGDPVRGASPHANEAPAPASANPPLRPGTSEGKIFYLLVSGSTLTSTIVIDKCDTSSVSQRERHRPLM